MQVSPEESCILFNLTCVNQKFMSLCRSFFLTLFFSFLFSQWKKYLHNVLFLGMLKISGTLGRLILHDLKHVSQIWSRRRPSVYTW